MPRLTPLLLLLACGPKAQTEVPTNDKELTAWVEAGEYLRWAHEPEPHPSSGPHFGDVQTYINQILNGSLKGRGEVFEVGAASVKELYGDTAEVQGWAVMVKVKEGEGESTWYWWERYEGETLAQGVGKDVCASCHQAGMDYFLTDFPDTTGGSGL